MADSASAAARGDVPTHPTRPPAPRSAWTAPAHEPPLVRPLRPAVARRVLAGAIALGLLFQALFVGQLAGLNVPLWIAGSLAVGALLAPRPSRLRRSDAWLPAAALAFATLVAARASPALVAALPTLPPDTRDAVGRVLLEQRRDLRRQAQTSGWPSWNRSRVLALDALEQLPGG